MNFPPPPNVHAVAVMFLSVLALILFTREKIQRESSSFLVLIFLAVGFELFPLNLARYRADFLGPGKYSIVS
ncbi:MAG: hypothetical protein PF503_14530 [Desulfobacula sp.]|jgi:hypothetical protein|nr:hypothetical protein [Desulfobacula sp.]